MGISRGWVYNDWSHSPILLSLSPKDNILTDQTGHARIADFGLLTIVSDPMNPLSSGSYTQGGTTRWMSPELINPQQFGFKKSRSTKPSDCYALGMVIYETISGKLSFHRHADMIVILKVLEGERPPRGARFTENLWKTLELCWASQPNDRPSIEDVLQRLEVISSSSEPPFPGAEEMEEDSDDYDSMSCSSGVSNRMSGTARTRRCTTASSNFSCLANRPFSPVSAASPIEVIMIIGKADLDFLISQLVDKGIIDQKPFTSHRVFFALARSSINTFIFVFLIVTFIFFIIIIIFLFFLFLFSLASSRAE